jgi:excisionase family DNA binding protein
MEYLSVKQVAQRLQISPAAVYELCAARRLPHLRLGLGRGTIRIRTEDLAAFLESCAVKAHALANAAGLKHIRLPEDGSP